MPESLMEMLTSKKFITALATTIGALIARLGFNVEIETVAVIITPLIIYIGAQGMADKGKTAAVIQATNPAPPAAVVEQNVNVGDEDQRTTASLGERRRKIAPSPEHLRSYGNSDEEPKTSLDV